MEESHDRIRLTCALSAALGLAMVVITEKPSEASWPPRYPLICLSAHMTDGEWKQWVCSALDSDAYTQPIGAGQTIASIIIRTYNIGDSAPKPT